MLTSLGSDQRGEEGRTGTPGAGTSADEGI